MIDTHAHIYLDHFQGEVNEVVNRALDNGVKKILLPNIDGATIDQMLNLETKYPGVCYSMIGLHPCSVKKKFDVELRLIEEWLNKRKFLAIGEIGTDLYWDKTFWEQQKEAFHFQCELALKYDLPIVVHCRETLDETIELVGDYESRKLRGVFHCFTGSVEQAKQITEFGFYLGLGGVCTFKNGGMDEVIPHLDKDRILLETDSPYLAPTPHRGQRNEPAHTLLIAEKLASCFGSSKEFVDELTTKNANTLFFPLETND